MALETAYIQENLSKKFGNNVLNFEMKPKLLEIRYSDNGKGIDPGAFSKKGLRYAENRIHAVKGTITFDIETIKGFRVIIQIPK